MLAFALLSKKGGQELRMCQKNHAIKMLPRTGFEPVTYGLLLLNRLQSTALPTELSRVVVRGCSRSYLRLATLAKPDLYSNKAELVVPVKSGPPLNTLSTNSLQ